MKVEYEMTAKTDLLRNTGFLCNMSCDRTQTYIAGAVNWEDRRRSVPRCPPLVCQKFH